MTLNDYRKRAGVSMTELSKYAAVPRRTLYRYFKNPSPMTGNRMRAIGEVLGMSNEEIGSIISGKEVKRERYL